MTMRQKYMVGLLPKASYWVNNKRTDVRMEVLGKITYWGRKDYFFLQEIYNILVM